MKKYSELFDENLESANNEKYRKSVKCVKRYYGQFGLIRLDYNEGNNSYTIINLRLPLSQKIEQYLTTHICFCIKKFIANYKSILVVGLGNRHISSDNLGANAIRYITPKLKGKINVVTLSTGVTSQTGISAFDIIKNIVSSHKIDCVILVDALCASAPNRLTTSYQIHNAGISPGSGVDNDQKTISKQTLGVDVISIGVPLVMYAYSFGEEKYGNMIVTIKDIDIVSKKIARIVGNAINMALHHIDYNHSLSLNQNIF